MQNSRNTLIITMLITIKSKSAYFVLNPDISFQYERPARGVWLILSVCRASVQAMETRRCRPAGLFPIHTHPCSPWFILEPPNVQEKVQLLALRWDTIKRSQRPWADGKAGAHDAEILIHHKSITSPSQTQGCFYLSPVLVSVVTVCVLQRLPHHQSVMETLVKLGLWQKAVTRSSFYSF